MTIASGSADQGSADPGSADPGSADPGSADPGSADPGSADPGSADPGSADPGSDELNSADRRSTTPRRTDRKRGGKGWHELPVLVVVALVLAVLVKTFLVQAFFIPSGSMEQTLHGCPGCRGDRVLVNKVLYKVRGIRRGEIVVFNGVDSFDTEVPAAPPANELQRVLRGFTRLIGLGAPGEKDYIKRVIGLPGDRVACCSHGHVTVQPKGSSTAVELHESYLYQDDQQVFCAAGTDAQCGPGAPGVLVPPGRLWVMGDHRGASSDSRANGTIPIDRVIGRAFVVVWPFTRIKTLPVPSTFH